MNKSNNKFAIGIDIGGTKCAVIFGKGEIPESYDSELIIERQCFRTASQNGWRETLSKIEEVINRILEQRKIRTEDLVGIGISCGGPLDHKRGIILNPPNLIGWTDVPIVDFFQQRYEVPVYLQNDANACVLAEWRFGAAKGANSVVFLTFGTGLGAGLILDGRLYHGANDMAGEVGHIRLAESGPVGYGKAGSMEGFCSGGGIAQIARIKILEKLQCGETPELLKKAEELEKITAQQIGIAAQNGDKLAIEILETSARYLGKGLSILVDILNPEVIVIGSIYERCEKFMKPVMLKTLKKEGLERSVNVCRVVSAGLKNEIGDYAALSVAFGQ